MADEVITPSSVDALVDDVAGHLNAQHGRLIDVTIWLLANTHDWQGDGLWTPQQYLAWRAGVSPTMASNLVKVAERADEFPVAIDMVRRGEMSLDQLMPIVRKVPGWADAQVASLAHRLTVSQVRRLVSETDWAWTPGPTVDDEPGESKAGESGPGKSEPGGATELHEESAGPQRESGQAHEATTEAGDEPESDLNRVNYGFGEDGRWYLHADLDADLGAEIHESLDEARDALFRERNHSQAAPAPGNPTASRPTATGRAASGPAATGRAVTGRAVTGRAVTGPTPGRPTPGTDECGETDGSGETDGRAETEEGDEGRDSTDHTGARASTRLDPNVLVPVSEADAFVEIARRAIDGIESQDRRDRFRVSLFLGLGGDIRTTGHITLPDSLRDLLTCDGRIDPVFLDGATPVSIGQSSRVIPDRLRRVVLHRDHGCCRVPGCTATRGLDLHHIVHWSRGGPTDSANLITVCSRHHRMHHKKRLGIVGNADDPDSLEFTNQYGLPIRASGANPTQPTGPPPPIDGEYEHPIGERLDSRWVTFVDPTIPIDQRHHHPGLAS